MSENETVMAVCAEWRDCIESADPSVWNDERIAGLVKTTRAQQLAYLARIKAAWKREKAEIEADALAVGGIVEAARHKPGNATEHAMTLDEAIEHAENVADRCDTSCGREHRQLAEWLKELRDIRRHGIGNAAAMRDDVVLRLSREEYKGMQEALAEHDRLCEMLSESRMSVGNAAAMRKALVELTDKVLDYLHMGLIQLPLPLEDATAKARAALSAPARNCDKYDNFNDALRQFVKERPDTKKIDEQGRSVATAETYCVFANWLITPAAERKGEGDGR